MGSAKTQRDACSPYRSVVLREGPQGRKLGHLEDNIRSENHTLAAINVEQPAGTGTSNPGWV